MSLKAIEQVLHGAVRELMEKNSLIGFGKYDAVPIPEITTIEVYTCDLNWNGDTRNYTFYTGSIITTKTERATHHWGEGCSMYIFALSLETEIMWYDAEFGEISKFIEKGIPRSQITLNLEDVKRIY
jgi:hypothetical protein